MKTQPVAPFMPPAPDTPPPGARTNWLATVVAGGLALLIAVGCGFVIANKSSALSRAESDLARTRETLSQRSSDLDDTKASLAAATSSLASTNSDLSEARDDLALKRRLLKATAGCSYAAMEAWYSTTSQSFSASGWALYRAVTSTQCRVVRNAYNDRSGGNS
jgi:hypothetical protein